MADLIWWEVGYVVGCRVVPFVSCGKVQAGPLESYGYNWLGYKRDMSGRLELDSTLVAGVGLMTCAVGLAVILYFIH